MDSQERQQQLKHKLEVYAEALKEISGGLRRVVDLDVTFIACDAHVLRDHPELSASETAKARLDAATHSLDEISTSWYELADRAEAMMNECSLVLGSVPPKTIN